MSGATLGALTLSGGWSAWGVFNFGGPYPPKNPNQKFRDRWKTHQKALTCPKNTPARTLILKNKEREKYILRLYSTLQGASKRAVGADNFGELPPKSDRWNEPSSGHVTERPVETRRNYLEARRHS